MDHFLGAEQYLPSQDSDGKNAGERHTEMIIEQGKAEAHVIAREEIKELALRKRMATTGITKLTPEQIEAIDAKINKYSEIMSPSEISSMVNAWEQERSDLGLVEAKLPKGFNQLSKLV